MSKVSSTIQQLSGGRSGEAFSRDRTLEVLSNQRRRFVIHYLKHVDGEATVPELAEQVASWEYGKPITELTHQERKRVRNALRQFHLSKMDEYGFLEFDKQNGVVRLSDAASETNFYVDSLTDGDIPWGLYYLVLSGLSFVCLLGVWFSVFPFTLASPLAWGVVFVAALTVSSIGHFYDNYYRMRLGARETPAEVDDD